MSFMIKDDIDLEIWNKIKKTLNIKFHSVSVNDEKYIKVKVKEFNSVLNTNFLVDEVPKEGVHSDMKMEKKNYPQVYLKECKYKIKKKIPEFIDVELESDSSSYSE